MVLWEDRWLGYVFRWERGKTKISVGEGRVVERIKSEVCGN